MSKPFETVLGMVARRCRKQEELESSRDLERFAEEIRRSGEVKRSAEVVERAREVLAAEQDARVREILCELAGQECEERPRRAMAVCPTCQRVVRDWIRATPTTELERVLGSPWDKDRTRQNRDGVPRKERV